MSLQNLMSFDHITTNDLPYLPRVIGASSLGTNLLISPTGGRDGGPCLVNSVQNTAGNGVGLTIAVDPYHDVTIGAWIVITAPPGFPKYPFIAFCNPLTNNIDNFNNSHINITVESDGSLHVYRQHPNNPFTTFLGATAPGIISFSASPIVSTYVEVRVVIGDTGSVMIKANGGTVLDLTGVDTQVGSSSNVTYIALLGSYTTVRFDDVYITNGLSNGDGWNGIMGVMKIDGKLANGAGDITQWTPSTPTGVNWQNVDEDTPNLTDYNDALAVGLTDIYHIEDIGFDPIAIQVDLLAKKLDSGAASIAHVLKHDGTVYTSTEQIALSTEYKYYRKGYTKVPDSSIWTMAKFNALQGGPNKAV